MEFATIDNLLNVVDILKDAYADFYIYVSVDCFNVRFLKFSKRADCPKNTPNEFEFVLVNDYDLIANKNLPHNINPTKLILQYRKAMAKVCGKPYVMALKNYLDYKNGLKPHFKTELF